MTANERTERADRMGSGSGASASGVACHGSLIYLSSQTHLCCIGLE